MRSADSDLLVAVATAAAEHAAGGGGPGHLWGTVAAVDGDEVTVDVDDGGTIVAQPTAGAVVAGDIVRVEFAAGGAPFIVGVR